MPIETDYVPKYVDLEDVPIEGPDTYEDSAKRRALFEAESEFELDVNGGDVLPDDSVTDSHMVAVCNLATYNLVNSAVAPDDVTLGDMADGGGQSREYADSYLEAYMRIVSKIQDSDELGPDDDTGHGRNYSTSVNTRDADAMDRKYPFNRDDRFPDEH